MAQLGPGDEVGGYQIEALLARGGMGVIYRARQHRPERSVAVKVIAADVAGEPDFRRRFEHEASAAAEIEHPNVIPVYEVGEDRQLLFIAMRLVDGVDLAGLVAQRGRLEPRHVARLIAQAAAALDAAHSHGLVHRDVKPGNMLVRRGGHVYLTDFGISKRIADTRGVTKAGTPVGTPDYIAPEQVEGQPVNQLADVYALGCVTHQLLCGRVPFPRDSEIAKLFAHLSDPPPRLESVPAALADAVERAMAKRPEDRFQSAGEFGRAVMVAATGRAESGIGPIIAAGVSGDRGEPDAKASRVSGPAGSSARSHAPKPRASEEPGDRSDAAGRGEAHAARRRATDLGRKRGAKEVSAPLPGHHELDEPARLRRSSPATRLPVAATPFLGRKHELAIATKFLRETRLLTLTGAGGTGKTRLGLRLAETRHQGYSDGALFVAFADITDPQLIVPTISRALGLGEVSGKTPIERLREWFGERELLLVLDNLEQLAPGTSVLGEVLNVCSGLSMIVTSREPLHLAGEQQYEVPLLEREDAIELFVARAHAVAPDVRLDRELVGAICEQLDRLPLAIELTAARTKMLAPAEILDRLERHLPVIASGPRDAPDRQRTLQATMDWSYDLLGVEEQQLFARLSVFAGGCTLPAAEAVCVADLDTLGAVVDRSLIKSDGERYWMLQVLREYATDKLTRSGDADQFRRRHAEWFLDFAKRAAEGQRTSEQGVWFSRLDAETDNLRAVLAWCLEQDVSRGVELATTLVRRWRMRGHLQELISWLERALDGIGSTDERTRALALRTYGRAMTFADQPNRAEPPLNSSLELFRKLRDRIEEAGVLLELGLVARLRGSPGQAISLTEAALARYREREARDRVAVSLHRLGDLCRDIGDLERATATLDEALAIANELGDWSSVAAIGHSLGDLALDQGQRWQAKDRYRDALKAAIEIDNTLNQVYCVAGLACIAAMDGDVRSAGRLWAVVQGVEKRSGTRMLASDRKLYDRILMPLREHTGFRDGQEAGLELALDEAVHELVNA